VGVLEQLVTLVQVLRKVEMVDQEVGLERLEARQIFGVQELLVKATVAGPVWTVFQLVLLVVAAVELEQLVEMQPQGLRKMVVMVAPV
jgi:hypothetical protein